MSKILFAGTALMATLCATAEPVDSIQTNITQPDKIVAEFKQQVDSLDQVLKFHSGKIKFAEQSVRLTVPANHYFIDAPQSKFILENLWGNAQDEEVLGMIVRSDFLPNETNNDYSFVISYSPTGYISSAERVEFDHNDLLHQIQEQLQASNKLRVEQGLNVLQAENWVMVPYFDNYKKALYWATELKVNGSEESLINYNLRLLGKDGVIKINAVGTMDQLGKIKQVLPYLLAQTEFLEGFRYNEYNADTVIESNWKLEELIAGKQKETLFSKIPTPLAAGSILMIGTLIAARRFSNFKRKPVQATA